MRALTPLPAQAIAFEEQLVDADVPTNEHDRRVDLLVLPGQVVEA